MEKQIRKLTLVLAISAAVMTAVTGCGKEANTTEVTARGTANSNEERNESSAGKDTGQEQVESGGAADSSVADPQSSEGLRSLEQVSAKDGETFLNALKQQDTKELSALMAHAENEYTESDMAKVIEGFQLYFDRLEELTLKFEANEQNPEFYVEHYAIVGKKNGETRSIPFIIRYSKSQSMKQIQDDNKREPLYDSPLIGEYPYIIMDAERYIQALQQKDLESLSLHLGYVDYNEETQAAMEQLLNTYEEKLDLSTLKAVSKGYDEQEDQYHFELQDSRGQKHDIRIGGEENRIMDDWAAGSEAG
ncbi:hypothetical protein DNH61_04535 [Paenibacillus sambharensis]|uniref:DUF5105 domain-containing protein n=1 Tax=Paenibacillus sambharensis TaxID=1803190 RepID=A0A2W1LEQ1_9BACL|nr:hypothetical protein [Paenibacillus sambharensis]PZD97159.1 hypothetical protein DNH61_04535 [Paenibacillus sambharensis]